MKRIAIMALILGACTRPVSETPFPATNDAGKLVTCQRNKQNPALVVCWSREKP